MMDMRLLTPVRFSDLHETSLIPLRGRVASYRSKIASPGRYEAPRWGESQEGCGSGTGLAGAPLASSRVTASR